MARASKILPCMFCGDLPCTCNSKPKPAPKAAPKKAKKKSGPTEAPTSKPAMPGPDFSSARPLDRSEADNQQFAPIAVPTPEPRLVVEPAKQEKHHELKEAIRNLNNAGLLGKEDRFKYRSLFDPQRDGRTMVRLAEWKQRYQHHARPNG